MASSVITVHLADTKPFERLVMFVEDVYAYAGFTEDAGLHDLVRELREDLVAIRDEEEA